MPWQIITNLEFPSGIPKFPNGILEFLENLEFLGEKSMQKLTSISLQERSFAIKVFIIFLMVKILRFLRTKTSF